MWIMDQVTYTWNTNWDSLQLQQFVPNKTSKSVLSIMEWSFSPISPIVGLSRQMPLLITFATVGREYSTVVQMLTIKMVSLSDQFEPYQICLEPTFYMRQLIGLRGLTEVCGRWPCHIPSISTTTLRTKMVFALPIYSLEKWFLDIDSKIFTPGDVLYSYWTLSSNLDKSYLDGNHDHVKGSIWALVPSIQAKSRWF